MSVYIYIYTYNLHPYMIFLKDAKGIYKIRWNACKGIQKARQQKMKLDSFQHFGWHSSCLVPGRVSSHLQTAAFYNSGSCMQRKLTFINYFRTNVPTHILWWNHSKIYTRTRTFIFQHFWQRTSLRQHAWEVCKSINNSSAASPLDFVGSRKRTCVAVTSTKLRPTNAKV